MPFKYYNQPIMIILQLQPAPRAHFAEFQISKIIGVDTV